MVKDTKKSVKNKNLVIVESPAKSKTINKILGKNYKVIASMGHIIDLPTSTMGIDFDNNFEPKYVVMKDRKKYLNAIKKEIKNIKAIYLAADPDREGEAISWHIKRELEKEPVEFHRVSFNEITKKAVQEAFENPRQLDMDKVNAQQARRILDRIVGYSISPLLWKKITKGLSAGRVQSIAVKFIVQREKEIREFITKEYWTLEALLSKKEKIAEDDNISFKAKLAKYDNKKIEISNKEQIDAIILDLEKEKFLVEDIKNRKKTNRPRMPYTTSILQQDAFNKLNFSASKTMKIAQSLYEGVDIGEEGSIGLITYMRTDSVRISKEAEENVRKYIKDIYGEKYCPKSAIKYKTKKKMQDAHEAVRPTLPLRSPDTLTKYLTKDEMKLYVLIWNRFVSSQMENAIFSIMTIEIIAGKYLFTVSGSRCIFDGYLKPYEKYKIKKDNEDVDLPVLKVGEQVLLEKFIPEQHFTKPPARYTDASLVKILEEKGIGRPSTYAPIIRTIISRNYVKRLGKSLQPTELGELVDKLLIEHFPDIVNDEFTAKMEQELDNIEEGNKEWIIVLKDFYNPFVKTLEQAKKIMNSMKKEIIKTEQKCEKCGKDMVVRWGRHGKFLSCIGFPDCRNAKSITTGVKCPNEGCDGELVERKSKRGTFYGCTKYPKCTFISRTLPQQEQDGQIED